MKLQKHCESCQGECNGQQKRTFDLNSSAQLNSFSNRHLQKGHRFGLHPALYDDVSFVGHF